MNKLLTLFFILAFISVKAQENKVITRQGQVSFFSYTSVENIEATNNQVLSIIDLETGELAVNMLMRAFVFKKAMMEEHFNESYVESDLYPKLQFSGKIDDFDSPSIGNTTKMIKGTMDFHGVQKEIEIKTRIGTEGGLFVLEGNFEVGVPDYDIKVPHLLAPNIAKDIKVEFRFEYTPYEEN